MVKLRFIGDVHGRIDQYIALCREAEHSIQVGDLGFAEHYAQVAAELDPTRHKYIPGNHDDLDHLPPHCLGDFGVHGVGRMKIFFMRGAFSIDREYRQREGLWWPNEELSDDQLAQAVELYAQIKPKWVVTHDCPLEVAHYVSNPDLLQAFGHDADFQSRTQRALQTMFDLHQPERWIFGHFHRNATFQEGRTWFTCLDEMAVLDL